MPTDFRKLHYMGSVWEYAESADGLEYQRRVFEIRLNLCRAAIAHLQALAERTDEDSFILDIARSEQDRLQETLDEIARRLAKVKKGHQINEPEGYNNKPNP